MKTPVSHLLAAALLFALAQAPIFGATNLVKIGDYFFNLTNITINVGDTIIWSNSVSTSHDSTSDLETNVWASPNLTALSRTFAFKFTNPGSYPYICKQHIAAHPEQTGTVSVVTMTNTPPAAVTILNTRFNGSAFSFSFATQVGYNYTGQVTPSLNPVSWFTLTNLAGNGSVVQFTDSNLTNSPRFYRVGAQ